MSGGNDKRKRKKYKSVYDIVPIPQYIPKPMTITRRQDAVKIATPDLFIPLRSDAVPVESMADMIFEDIGGQEILNVMKTDMVGDIDIEYQPVKDLRQIYLSHDSASLVGFTDTSSAFFNSFPINLDEYVLNETLIINNGYAITEPIDGVAKKLSIIDATGDGTNVTYTTSTDHGLVSGDTVYIYNINPSAYNSESGAEVLLTPNDSEFVIANTTTAEYIRSNLLYIDPENGDLVIEIAELPSGVTVEVEIWEPDKYFDTDRMLNGEPAPKPPL